MNQWPDNPETPEDETADGQPERRYGGGKYKDVDALEQGYSESFRELERLRSQSMAAEARAAAAEALLAQQRMQTGSADEDPDYLPISEEGLRREDIAGMVGKLTKQAVAEALAPLVNTANARSEMVRNVPEYAQAEPEVQQFLAKDPQVQATYNRIAGVDPEAALQFAFAQWRSSRPASPNGPAFDQQRLTASLPSGASGPGQARQEERGERMDARTYNKLLSEARESGNFDAFLDYRLRGVLPQEIDKRGT